MWMMIKLEKVVKRSWIVRKMCVLLSVLGGGHEHLYMLTPNLSLAAPLDPLVLSGDFLARCNLRRASCTPS